MLGGIEAFARFAEGRHAQLLEHACQLGHGHFHALLERIVRSFLLERTLKIVIHRQELADGLGPDVGVKIVLFALRALAEVIIFRCESQIAVMLLCKRLLSLFKLGKLLLLRILRLGLRLGLRGLLRLFLRSSLLFLYRLRRLRLVLLFIGSLLGCLFFFAHIFMPPR